jgi:hypothetical protein
VSIKNHVDEGDTSQEHTAILRLPLTLAKDKPHQKIQHKYND